jgi:Fur family transcriptional regulator, ferric uptake regulator
MDKPTATDLLRSAELRLTEPRAAILSVLLETGAPLTQEQIAERIGTAAPNKTTIYRTLMSLVEKGLVHKAYLEERTWHFELAHHCGKHQCHPHFTCSACQQTQCLPEVSMPLIQLPEGYVMQRQQVRIEGVCSNCHKH